MRTHLQSNSAAHLDVRVHLGSDTDKNGRVSIVFTARGIAQPGIWSPAFGRPRPMPMTPDGTNRWRLKASLPTDCNASWAALAAANAVKPTPQARLSALLSPRGRVAVGKHMDSQFTVPEATAPSLYRLIGADSQRRMEANIGLMPTPGAHPLNNDNLCAEAPRGASHTLSGHHLVTMPGENRRALFLDGEVLRRCDNELAATGWARSYLDNRGAAQRMQDHRHPLRLAHKIAPLIADAETQPDVIVGTSATAPTALALGSLLGARRVILLSPVFLDKLSRARLIAGVESTSMLVDVFAGSEENGAGDPRRSVRDNARTFAADVRNRGGNSRFTEFSGGHDLPAWRVALMSALHRTP